MTALLLPMFLVIVGLAALIFGGELLVRGAAGFAAILKISPLIVGLTIVAFCTSAPELAISVRAAWVGQADLAVGNVVGSNICNVLLVLGLSALLVPLAVDTKLIRWETPLVIVVSLLFYAICLTREVGRLYGVLLFLGLIGYLVWSIVQARREDAEVQEELAASVPQAPAGRGMAILCFVLLVLGGLALLVLGSHWLVLGAVQVAELLKVSPLVIGLSVVALGTSLPELAVSVIAAIRGRRELAVGNVIGSNLFNILCVLGLTATVSPKPIPVPAEALYFDIPIMIGAAVVCLPFFITGAKLDRTEGAILLLFYIAYIACLAASAVSPPIAEILKQYLFGFGGPFVLLMAFISALRAWRGGEISNSLPQA